MTRTTAQSRTNRQTPAARPTAALQRLLDQVYPHQLWQRRTTLLLRVLLVGWLLLGVVAVAVSPITDASIERLALTLGSGPLTLLLANMPLPRAYAGMITIAVTTFGALLPLVLAALLSNPPQSAASNLRSARLARARQQGRLDPTFVARRYGLRTPGVPVARVGSRVIGLPQGADRGHIMVIAPTRSGKGLALTHTLLTWHAAAVVVDPKGEQWQRTAGWRAQHVGPVHRIPAGGIDLLDYFATSGHDLQELHRVLLHRSGSGDDRTFVDKILALFNAVVATAAATGTHAMQLLAAITGCPPGPVLQVLQRYAPAATAQFLDGDAPGKPNRFTLTAWGIFTSRIAPLAQYIATWTTATVPRDWASQRATIYITVPLEELGAAGPLVASLVSALLRGQVAATERHPTLFAIDELPAIGLPDLSTVLATVGGAGVTVLGYIQNLAQLEQVYGREGAQAILGNCAHQVYYAPRDRDTAETISHAFGTTLRATQSRSSGREGRTTISEREVRELEPADVAALPEDAVVLFSLLGGRQLRLLAQRLDPRALFAALPPPPTPPTASEVDLHAVLAQVGIARRTAWIGETVIHDP